MSENDRTARLAQFETLRARALDEWLQQRIAEAQSVLTAATLPEDGWRALEFLPLDADRIASPPKGAPEGSPPDSGLLLNPGPLLDRVLTEPKSEAATKTLWIAAIALAADAARHVSDPTARFLFGRLLERFEGYAAQPNAHEAVAAVKRLRIQHQAGAKKSTAVRRQARAGRIERRRKRYEQLLNEGIAARLNERAASAEAVKTLASEENVTEATIQGDVRPRMQRQNQR